MTRTLLLCLLLSACAQPYVKDGVHWNDLSKCERGAGACYMAGEVYCSDVDPILCQHELVFHKRNGGGHEEWKSYGGIPYAVVTDAGRNKDYRKGDCMMRADNGPITHCDARIRRLVQTAGR